MRTRGIGTVKKAVRSYADLKGLKLLSSGKWVGARQEALGAVPTSIPPSDMYPDLQKGILDGSGGTPFTLEDYKLGELYKYIVANCAWPPAVFNLTMSLKAWNSLSPDQQKVFTDTNAWFEDYVDQIQLQVEKDRIAAAKIKYPGIEWVTLPQDDLAKMDAGDKPVQDKFSSELDSKSLPGSKLMAEYLSLTAKYSASSYAPDWAK